MEFPSLKNTIASENNADFDIHKLKHLMLEYKVQIKPIEMAGSNTSQPNQTKKKEEMQHFE